jgi:hypothetical protein
MMIAVAVVAVLMGIVAALERRARHFRRLSFLQSVEANRWEMLLGDEPMDESLASAILQTVSWHDDMAARYARTARTPWTFVEPARQEPPTPELPASVAARRVRGRYPWPPKP